ncbi:MAG: hypothetical protein PPP58_10145 [Natronomonas sp.]
METVYDLAVSFADRGLGELRADGSMPPGCNGPWDDAETPVRNTGHWLITFLEAHEITDETRYLDAARDAAAYLLSEEARPHGETFHHRHGGDRDRCNGLIGQAWSIEALAVAAERLDDTRLCSVAERTFLRHPFDRRLAAWRPVEIDGTSLPLDMTFNHQLWFAAAGAILANLPEVDPRVGRRVERFLDELAANVDTTPEGRIEHIFKPEFDLSKYLRIFYDGLRAGTAHKMVAGQLRSILGRDGDGTGGTFEKQAVGYHSFNLYGLAILYDEYPDHRFWETRTFRSTLEYAESDTYERRLADNPYGYPYNCAGIELAVAFERFGVGDDETRRAWIGRQLEATYDDETGTFSRNTPDPRTLTARIYEATRLSDIRLPESIHH